MARRITLILLAGLVCASLLLVLGGVIWTREKITCLYDDQGCQSVQSGAAITQHVLEKAITDGAFDLEAVFEAEYQLEAGSSPQRFHTEYDRYLARNLRPLQGSFLNARFIYYAYAVTTDGYVPVHTDPELDGVRYREVALDLRRPLPDPHERRVTKAGPGLTFWEYDAPIVVLGRLWGFFRVGVREELVHHEILRQVIVMSAILATFSLVLAGLTFYVVRRNLRPLAGLISVTADLAAGDFSVRCPAGGRGEIAAMASSFNAMAEALQDRDLHLTSARRALGEAQAELGRRAFDRTAALEHASRELSQTLMYLQETQTELFQSQKLASVGQLAAGIAHEINTPTQFIADNVEFLRTAVRDLLAALDACRGLIQESPAAGAEPDARAQLDRIERDLDLAFLRSEVPGAIDQALEGTRRISEIVRAMKQFAHPERGELTHTDLNECIRSTVTVARNEWKYVTEMVLDLDPGLPLVPCMPGEFNQVILNLVVNAAHAIGDVVNTQAGEKGRIRISSRVRDDQAEIAVVDTGTGIPLEIRDRIFDPFFSTKEVGRGIGQGLAIARSVIVERLHGSLTFETEVGRGTTFLIRLPLTRAVTRRAAPGYHHHDLAYHSVRPGHRDPPIPRRPPDREPGTRAPTGRLAPNLSSAVHASCVQVG